MTADRPRVKVDQLSTVLEIGYKAQVPVRLIADDNMMFGFREKEGIRVFQLQDNEVVVMGSDDPLAIHFDDWVATNDKALGDILLPKCSVFLVDTDG